MFSSRVTTKSKMVSSGRLTGAVTAQPHSARRTPKPRAEPAYSLYSTESEDQVTSLHKGLDRCAALLGDILQCESKGAVPKQDKAVKEGAAKSRPHTPNGKKAIRRSVTKSAVTQRSSQVVRRRSTTIAPGTTPQRSTPTAAHSGGVKLHPLSKRHNLLKTSSIEHTPQQLSPSVFTALCHCSPVPLTNTQPALDSVPVRDQGPGEGCLKTHSQDRDGGAETEDKLRKVRCLLGELRTLMAGNSAETHLSHLERTMFSSLSTDGTTKNQAESPGQTQTQELQALQSQNTLLQRQVKALNQQLQDQESARQLFNSNVSSLQGELSTAEALQDVHRDLTIVQKALQETQSQMKSKEEENTRLKTELESTRGRLRVSLLEKFKLEGVVQQKQEEIEELRRIIDTSDSSNPTLKKVDLRLYPPGPAQDHITQYLMSLEQLRPGCPEETLYEAVDRNREPSLDQGPEQEPERDMDSVIYDWSIRSESTFNTRDEAAFKDGLAALDASIASLQRTLKMDLVRTTSHTD